MALIPPFFLDCVVAIGRLDQDSQRTHWLGSGFLVGQSVRDAVRGSGYRTYLVTNRHVLADLTEAQLRFNPEANEPARQFTIDLGHQHLGRLWFLHPDPVVDVAVVPISIEGLRAQGIRCSIFQSDQHILTRDDALQAGLTEGDPVYVLGFPMGLVGEKRNYVIVRQGCLARVRDALTGDSREFLVDAAVFPGNSGGPVVTRPEVTAVGGTSAHMDASLIGIVTGYLPYQDLAVSQQTQQPRIIFVENSGLASVTPYDFVAETIREHLNTVPGADIPEASVTESDAPVEDMGANPPEV